MQAARRPFALLCAALLALGAGRSEAAAPGLIDLGMEELLQVDVVDTPPKEPAQAPVPPAADRIRPRDYRPIAGALLNFTRFIEWPDESAGDFHICVAGVDPFGPELDALASRSVHSRPVRIERGPNPSAACQLVFVPTGTLPPPAVRGMLIVAEDADALSQGAAIVVGLDGKRVVFDINPKAARTAGLKISYKLLRLARLQHRGG